MFSDRLFTRLFLLAALVLVAIAMQAPADTLPQWLVAAFAAALAAVMFHAIEEL